MPDIPLTPIPRVAFPDAPSVMASIIACGSILTNLTNLEKALNRVTVPEAVQSEWSALMETIASTRYFFAEIGKDIEAQAKNLNREEQA